VRLKLVVSPDDPVFVNETMPTALKDEMETVKVFESTIDFTG
tara:strand:+ start:506 stop:631 length:126 start_codon:yes stop_codon:yes gene_type:complete